MNWRTLRQAQIDQSQFPHNPQNRPALVDIEKDVRYQKTLPLQGDEKEGEDGIARPREPTPQMHGKPSWLAAYRKVAVMVHGIERDNPVFKTVMRALDECDEAYHADDYPRFQRAMLEVYKAVHTTEIDKLHGMDSDCYKDFPRR